MPPAATHCLSVNSGPAVWATYRRDGRGQRYFRSPGGINFLPAGEVMSWVLADPLSLLKVSVPRTTLRAVAEEMELDARVLELRVGVQVRDTQLEWLAGCLRAEADTGNSNGILFRQTLEIALSLLLVRRFASSLPVPRMQAGRFAPLHLRRITDYVESNLGRTDLSLRELAAVAGMGVSQFKSVFKHSTGVGAHRFVVERRVERAAELLRLGRSGISDVAAQTGFSHATHLARWTRRLLGVSPGQLLRRN